MTDRVENNVLRPIVTEANTTTTSNTNQNVSFSDALFCAGQVIAGMGSRANAARAAYNNAGGCFGYGFGGMGGNFFPVPGLDATDIWARTRLLDNFNGITDIMKGTGNVGSTGASGITDDATAAQKTTNPAEPFTTKLDYEKVKQMAEKEEAIARKEAELKAEQDKKDAADKEKIDSLSKELYDLRKEYEKLDKEYGGGSELSKAFGGKGSFYRNISEKEFTQIQDINAEIKTMKEELKKLEDEGVRLAQEYTNTKQQLMNAGKPTDEQSVLNAMSASSRERFTQVKDQREEQIKAIENKIKELKSFIEKAGKDDNDTNFYTHIAEKTAEEKKKASSTSTVASQIKSKMFADGKLRKKDDVLAEMSEGKTEVEKDDIKAVLDILYNDTTDDMEEKSFKDKLRDESFFANATKLDMTTETGKRRATLLVKTYNDLMGSNAWKTYGQSDSFSDKSIARIVGSMNDATKAPSSTAKAPESSAGTETPDAANLRNTQVGRDLDAARKKAREASSIAESNKDNPDAQAAQEVAEEALRTAEETYQRETSFKEEIDNIPETRIKSLVECLKKKNETIKTLQSMTDAEVVRVFRDSENAEDIISGLYDGDNDYNTAKLLCVRLNAILEDHGIDGRIKALTRKPSPNSVEYTSRNDGEEWNCNWTDGLAKTRIVTISSNSDNDNFADCAQMLGIQDTVAPALNAAAEAIWFSLN